MQCHVYGKKCTQPTNVGGVSARRRSGAPPRRGCVANSRMTKSCNKLVRSPPALLCCFPPPVDGQASVSSPRPSINVPRAQEATQLISPPPPVPPVFGAFHTPLHHTRLDANDNGRMEYRNRHKASSMLQRLWRTRRAARKAEEEKQRRIAVEEVSMIPRLRKESRDT